MGARDLTIFLGHWSLLAALFLAGWSMIASLVGTVSRGRGMQFSAERAVWAASAFVAVATGCLVAGFLADDFRIDYVYHYSSRNQALAFKIGALWGGQAGSLLLWALILAAMSSLMVATNRNKNRALMPWATAVVGTTLTFFMILLNFVEPPFLTGPARPDGVGLNPQLKNYWMMIHPPSLYLGYVAFTVPFAFAIAALATRRTGDLWFRTTRRWTIFAWFFLGTGILLGSYWAYIELGWGGYWAWDPVENASLMPWLAGTAFLHSVMIQEKKGMLKIWNMLLIILTFSLSIFGTFLTRSGVISSVHAFATSDIGPAFGVFLFLVFFGSVALLITRLDGLRSDARLESVVSRESTFLFNNMIFVGLAATILLLTTFPMLSEWATGRKVTMGPPIFNLVNVPWALVLLFLAGVGPLIAWRRASRANLKRNFLTPGLVGLWCLLAYVARFLPDHTRGLRELGAAVARADVAGALDAFKAFYPAITFGIGSFVLATVSVEFYRGLRVRMRRDGRGLTHAAGRMVWHNKRRWGGYVVHVGMVAIFFGIAASSAYQKEAVRRLAPGEVMAVDDYLLRYDSYRFEAEDDHIAAITRLALFDRHDGRALGYLAPEQRLHPNFVSDELRNAFERAKSLGARPHGRDDDAYHAAVVGLYPLIASLEQRFGREVKTPSTEVAIRRFVSPTSGSRFGEDFYVIPLYVDPTTGEASFRVFVNPLVNFLWWGGLIFVAGAVLTILPDRRERERLAQALDLEEREIA